MKELISNYPAYFRLTWMSWNSLLAYLFFIAPVWFGGGITQFKYRALITLGMLAFLPMITYLVRKTNYLR